MIYRVKYFILIILIGISYSTGKIHFIYNANDDIFSVINDFFHKSLSPKTYDCDLCALSYGMFSKKEKWSNFLDSLQYDYAFIYKNQSNPILDHVDSFPVILFQQDDDIMVLVSTDDISKCNSIDELIFTINLKLTDFKQ